MTEHTSAILKKHEQEMEVRDYECDMADGVNNSVYYNYFEHARHSMLKAGGIDFAELARQRIGLIVARAEIDFKRSLVSGDKFKITTVIRRISKIRFEFSQEIFKLPDLTLIASAKVIGLPIDPSGKPKLTPDLEALILPMLSEVETA